MSFWEIAVFTLKFYIPGIFAILFRIFALGCKSRQRAALGISAHAFYMLLVPAVIINAIGYGQYTHIAFYVMLVSNLAVLIFTTDPPAKTVFLQLVGAVAVSMLSSVLGMARHLTNGSYSQLLFATLIGSVLLFACSLRFFREPMRFIRDNLHSSFSALLLLPFLALFMGVLISTYPPQNFANHPIFCTAMTLLVQGSFFLYLYTLYRNLRIIRALSQRESQRELLELSLAAARQRLTITEDAMGQINVAQHDQHHVGAVLLELLESGETDKAAAILKERAAITPKPARYCDNVMVNAAVAYYAALAEQNGIRLDLRLDIPEALSYSELGLSMVLANLMENAVHACKILPSGRERYFRAASVYTGQLVLELENPYCGEVAFDEDGYPIAQGDGHGRGSESVRAFV